MSQGEVFTRYRALFSSSSIPPYESESIKKINDLEFVDFLFELIKASKGQKNYKNIILKGVLGEMKMKTDINLKIKKILKTFYACDVNILIPSSYTVNSVGGIEMDLSDIDPQGLLKIDANTQLGKHLFDGNIIDVHLNFLLSQALKAPKDKPLTYEYKDRKMFEIYASSMSSVNFKFGDYYTNRPLADWVTDYIDSTDFFNLPNFTAMMMDIITGAISLKAGKKSLEIKQDSGLLKALKKIFSFCSETKATDDVDSSLQTYLGNAEIDQVDNNNNEAVTGNDFFAFTPRELQEIEDDANLRSAGSIRFSTCGNLDIGIDPDEVLLGLDRLFGSAQLVADKNIDDLIPEDYDNADTNFNVDNANNFFDTVLKTGVKKVIDAGEDGLVLSFPNMQAEMQLGIFKAIPYALIKSVLSPKLLLLPKISAAVIGVQSHITVPEKDTKYVITQLTPVLRDIGLSIVDKMLKNIFDVIKKDILQLTKELAVRYIKQRGSDYILTLSSILRLLNLLKAKDNSRCKSVISKLLSLLNLGSFGAMPSIPDPLILIGGALKPGLNKIALVNDLKSRLQNKGIETAPYFPDGTPNYMMYAMEEVLGVISEHIKTRAKIDTFAIGPTGPVKGYGQIQ